MNNKWSSMISDPAAGCPKGHCRLGGVRRDTAEVRNTHRVTRSDLAAQADKTCETDMDSEKISAIRIKRAILGKIRVQPCQTLEGIPPSSSRSPSKALSKVSLQQLEP
jgi:hypothetical protein